LRPKAEKIFRKNKGKIMKKSLRRISNLVENIAGKKRLHEAESPIDKSSNPDVGEKLYNDIVNDSQLYRSRHEPILKNLTAKKAKEVYDHNLAIKLFIYLVQDGVKKYGKDYGGKVAKDVQLAVAEELTNHFEAEHKLGNYDHMVPKKYKK
jgi:hypothetical protein